MKVGGIESSLSATLWHSHGLAPSERATSGWIPRPRCLFERSGNCSGTHLLPRRQALEAESNWSTSLAIEPRSASFMARAFLKDGDPCSLLASFDAMPWKLTGFWKTFGEAPVFHD